MNTNDLIKVLRGQTIYDLTDLAAQGILLEAADRIEDFEKIAEFYHRELEKVLSERESASKTAHGSWIVTDGDDGMCESYAGFVEFKCSECGTYFGIEDGQYGWYFGDNIPWKHCPICGAKMDGERREG